MKDMHITNINQNSIICVINHEYVYIFLMFMNVIFIYNNGQLHYAALDLEGHYSSLKSCDNLIFVLNHSLTLLNKVCSL